MRAKLSHLIIAFASLLISTPAFSQQDSSLFNKLLSLPDKVFGKIDHRSSRVERKLDLQTDRYLQKLKRQEEKLKQKLLRRGDTAIANEVFGEPIETYTHLQNLYSDTNARSAQLQSYVPHADTLQNLLSFIQADSVLKSRNAGHDKINNSLAKVQRLQNRFSQSDRLKNYITQRQRYLKEKMQSLGMVKEYKKFQKQVYYYRAQVNEYKELFNTPGMLEKKLVNAASLIPAFQQFFAEHSQLASVFQLPGAGGLPTNANAVNTAFPTRAAVQQNLMNRLGAGINPQQAVQQGMQNGTNYFSSVRNQVQQITQVNQGNSDMPDFKVNTQKTKSFWKRIELGSNLQTVRGNYYFPTTSDLGLSAGFKISDKSIIGIGTSTKIGWGRGWNNIDITAQGLSLRSFLDMKLKGNFWITGGAEMNYRSQFRTIEVLKNYSAWQQSALIGLSKKYSIGKKWKGNAQIMYDFLWKQQVPQTQAFVFRIGYHL